MRIIEHVNLEYSEEEYEYVTVELDGIELVEYGDHYHDKGRERAEAFVQGWHAGRGETEQKPDEETRYFNEEEDE